MSLSTPKLQNPCKKFIEFKGNDGVFQYWDKENKKNVQMELPMRFIVLDELSTITGYHEPLQTGLYSNEVHSVENQPLNIRSFKGGMRIVGKYSEIKDRIKSVGAKFTKSVYIALVGDKGLEIANLKLSGAAFSSWCDKEVETAISIERFADGKKGAVKFKIPVWEKWEPSSDDMTVAMAMDKELQEFLKAKHVQDKEQMESEPVAEKEKPLPASKEDLEKDDIPF